MVLIIRYSMTIFWTYWKRFSGFVTILQVSVMAINTLQSYLLVLFIPFIEPLSKWCSANIKKRYTHGVWTNWRQGKLPPLPLSFFKFGEQIQVNTQKSLMHQVFFFFFLVIRKNSTLISTEVIYQADLASKLHKPGQSDFIKMWFQIIIYIYKDSNLKF